MGSMYGAARTARMIADGWRASCGDRRGTSPARSALALWGMAPSELPSTPEGGELPWPVTAPDVIDITAARRAWRRREITTATATATATASTPATAPPMAAAGVAGAAPGATPAGLDDGTALLPILRLLTAKPTVVMPAAVAMA